MSKQPSVFRDVLLLCIKFAFLGPLCLLIWWSLVPWYGPVLAQVSAAVLRYILRVPIEDATVAVDGLLNTGSQLVFIEPGGGHGSSPICKIITNVAPFVALILSTGGLTLGRRLRALAIGLPILLAGHVFVASVLYAYREYLAERFPQVVWATFLVFHTLPFLLWVILAYWDRLMSLFDAGVEEA